MSENRLNKADEVRHHKGITYRLKRVNCGREWCKKCSEYKEGHPYWYAYWKEDGKTRSAYIGKEFRYYVRQMDLFSDKPEGKKTQYGEQSDKKEN